MVVRIGFRRTVAVLVFVSASWVSPRTIEGETFLDVDRESMTPVQVTVERRAEPLDPKTDGRFLPEDKPAKETVLATLPNGHSIRLGKRVTHPHGASRRLGIIPESVRGWQPAGDKHLRVLTWHTYAQGQGVYMDVGVCVVRLEKAAHRTLYAGEVLVQWSAGGWSGGSGCRTVGARDGSLVIRDEVMKCNVRTWPDAGEPPPLYRQRRVSDLFGHDYTPDALVLAAEVTEKTIRTLSLADPKAAFVTRHYHRVAGGTTLDEIAKYYEVPTRLLLALNGKASAEQLVKRAWIEIPAARLIISGHKGWRRLVEPQLVQRLRKTVGDVSAFVTREGEHWYLRRLPEK